jgi:hypothetical protein
MGIVIEERRSELPGGFCYVRVDFQDGKVRVFDNNYKRCELLLLRGDREDRERHISLEETPRPRKRSKKMLLP